MNSLLYRSCEEYVDQGTKIAMDQTMLVGELQMMHDLCSAPSPISGDLIALGRMR